MTFLMMDITKRTILLFLLLLFHLLSSCDSHRWLKLARYPYSFRISDRKTCDTFRWLDRKQRMVCKRSIEMMEPLRLGAMESIEQCQRQFEGRRWNCSIDAGISLFGRTLRYPNKESAFVHALSSAGAAYSITRTCSSGALDTCGCDKSDLTNEPMSRRMITSQELHRQSRHERHQRSRGKVDLKWSGCNDNVAYGSAMARVFIDASEQVKGKYPTRALVNLHNNNAGRKAVENSVQIQCKCHGVSGSCELKTCWRAMTSFHTTASRLRDSFDNAIEVRERRVSASKRELVTRSVLTREPQEKDLVFLVPSPNFCEPSKKYGSLGTHFRACNKTSTSMEGCEHLCCGRGFFTQRSIVTERCHCKFHWCCSVKCQTCQFEREEYFCK